MTKSSNLPLSSCKSLLTIGIASVLLFACGSESDSSYGSANAGGASAVGAPSVQPAEAVEPGLCSLALVCPGEIVDAPAITCSFQVRDSASAMIYDDHVSIEIRGRTSRRFPKKSYDIELRTETGADNPTNLLGMGKDEDWVLDAAWADRSFMRNRLTYSLFREAQANQWAPEARYCELTINSRYAGIYVLLQKIKRDDDRAALPMDNGSGQSFIVRQKEDGPLTLAFGFTEKWNLVYPNDNVATPTQSQAAQRWLDSVSAALKGRASTGLTELFDVAKIVDWILIEEFAKNIDAYYLSVYFAHPSDGKAWVIPWDTDLAYGQPTDRGTRNNDTPTGWIAHRTPLISKLSAAPEIHSALGSRWRYLRAGILSNASVLSRLEAYQGVLSAPAIARNFALWPIKDVDFQPYYDQYSFYDVASYAEEVTHVRNWIEQRLDWLDANIDSYPTQ